MSRPIKPAETASKEGNFWLPIKLPEPMETESNVLPLKYYISCLLFGIFMKTISVMSSMFKEAAKKLFILLRLPCSIIKLIAGLIAYYFTGKTPPGSYSALIHLFCQTGGLSNDIMSKVISLFKGKYDFTCAQESLLGTIDSEKRREINSSLSKNGYYIFEKRLPDDLCEKLIEFSYNTQCMPRSTDSIHFSSVPIHYDPDSPKAVRYDIPTKSLINNKYIQEIISDKMLAQIVQDYIGSKPVIDLIAMWWHTNFQDKPDKEAAQFFHFDMDRIKWIKLFIYLTDVKSLNGPHTFVLGSHKTGRIPSKLLNKGYGRLTDEEVKEQYPNEEIIEFTGQRGTIILEDTRGLHKGKHVQEGDRLIFQIEYSNSLFGAYYPKVMFNHIYSDKLRLMLRCFPGLYRNFS